MSSQLFIDSLVAINLLVGVFLGVLLGLWLWRSGLNSLHRQQAALVLATLFPLMVIISMSHASWIDVNAVLGPIELVLAVLGGPCFLDLCYGQLTQRSCLGRSVVFALALSAVALFSGFTGYLVFLGGVYFVAALWLFARASRARKSALLVHVLTIAATIHSAQFLRFVFHDVGWLREIVPSTISVLGLGYLAWMLLPRQAQRRAVPDAEATRAVFAAVDAHLRASGMFRQAGLSVGAVSAALELPPYLVSQAINQHAGRFNDYINSLRIDAFLQSYQDERNVEALAHLAGFNSRSAFYRAFKTVTGKTPSQYFQKDCSDLQIRT